MADTTYRQRLAAALGVPDEKAQWDAGARQKALALATELRISRQAVEKYFRDASGAMSAENNARAARFLQVNPDWLATGEGDMRDARVWPFGTAISPGEFFALGQDDIRPALDVLRAAVARRQPRTHHAEPMTAGGLPVSFVERRHSPAPPPFVERRRGVTVYTHPQARDPDVFPPPRPRAGASKPPGKPGKPSVR